MLIKVSGSTISGHGGHNANVAVLDDDGNDVTPLPLISPNISKPPRGGGGGSHAASGSEIGIGKVNF